MEGIRGNPYPHRNFSQLEDFLEEITLLLSHEKGLNPISEAQGGYEDIVVNADVPPEAVSGSLFFEIDETSSHRDIAIRFKENGSMPTATKGQGVGHKDIFNPRGKQLLEQLRFIGIEADKSHTIRVQYYKTSQQ